MHENVASNVAANLLAKSDGRICAMSNDKTEPSKEELIWCTEYAESSCCSAAEGASARSARPRPDIRWRHGSTHDNYELARLGYLLGRAVEVLADIPLES